MLLLITLSINWSNSIFFFFWPFDLCQFLSFIARNFLHLFHFGCSSDIVQHWYSTWCSQPVHDGTTNLHRPDGTKNRPPAERCHTSTWVAKRSLSERPNGSDFQPTQSIEPYWNYRLIYPFHLLKGYFLISLNCMFRRLHSPIRVRHKILLGVFRTLLVSWITLYISRCILLDVRY